MEQNVRVLTIAELIQRGCSLTATSSVSLPSKSSSKPSISSTPTHPNPNPNPNPNSTPKILPPLDHFALIVGTVALPTTTPQCPYSTCFQFSDASSSASICCDVLDFNVAILNKRINVLAWNFIPSKRRGGGFLEIIRWSFADSISGLSSCSNFISTPLSSSSNEDISKARNGVFGVVESVSPLSTVSCARGDANSNKDSGSTPSRLRGFLVLFHICECKLCSSKDSNMYLKFSIQGTDAHSFRKPVFLYCCGSASSWHPVFTKLVGSVVALSGLKKKLVFIGKEESRVMCVTTECSSLHFSRLWKKCWPKSVVVKKGNGECGTYRGVVKGVYMKGTVVELDNEVWLLLTDQLLTPPHSLRTGALVSLRNVHFVNPKFSWAKMLILGACSRTSIIVESFSPMETGCHIVLQSQSSLGKFIDSLAFSSRLWVLLVASCFRKKFADILSDKEILGSKHVIWTVARCCQKEGVVEMYASSHLPSSNHQIRHGVFMEFCKHDSCVCDCEADIGNLNMVIPLSIFICHCEPSWMRALNLENKCRKLHDDKKYSLLLCDGRSYAQSIRKIFSSKDIGITLIGSLKTSPSSGRLQLVDATGSIDVLVPDLPSTLGANRIFKVVDYSLIIEGKPDFMESEGLLENDLFSCRTIFHFIPLARKLNLAVCVYFRLRSELCRNLSFYPSTGIREDLKRFESGTFHLFWITHKFPVFQKFQGDAVIANSASMFVEAIILPWNLSISGGNGNSYQTKVSEDGTQNLLESCAVESNFENGSFKRRKVSHLSSNGPSSESMDSSCEAVQKLNPCSDSHLKSSENQRFCDLSSREISCLAVICGVSGSVILHCTKTKLNSDGFCSPSGQKVLLEFKSESFDKYQLLQIGRYYITKHDREDSFCKIKGSNYFIGEKVLIPSATHLWSLSFGSDEVYQNNSSSKCLPLDNSLRNDEALSEYDNEVLLQMSHINSSETYSDITLRLSASEIGLGELKLKELKDNLIRPVVTPEDVPKISSCIRPVTNMPLPSTESMFPVGDLLSIRGSVVGIHGVEDNSVDPFSNCQNLGNSLEPRFMEKAASNCIHMLVGDQIVKLSGSLCKFDFPVGFGPGVDATVHRVLVLRGQNRLMLTSVSFIMINSIRAVYETCVDKCSSSASYMPIAAPVDNVCSGLICELVQCLDFKPMLLHCRVVAVHTLVLERKSRKVKYQLKNHSRLHLVDIPMAGFVLDDGSSSCCCWANAETAATLLRLYEKFPRSAFESSGWTLKWVGTDNNATIYHLERILENHHRIVVKNVGPMFDSSYQDLVVSVSSDNALSSYDENLLKFIIFNACFNKFQTIAASMIDVDAVRRLKAENLVETEISMPSMQHVWATEVQYMDPLAEAKNVLQDLLDG